MQKTFPSVPQIVDQHAADERVLLEALQKDLQEKVCFQARNVAG